MAPAHWNANPASYVPELRTKPDLGVELTTHTTGFCKIAALASMSTEVLQDSSTFLTFLPAELQHALTDAETNLVVNGTGSTGDLPGMLGLLNTAGTLTASPATDETPLDTLAGAFTALRSGSAFATADLVLTSPTTWNYCARRRTPLATTCWRPTRRTTRSIRCSVFG